MQCTLVEVDVLYVPLLQSNHAGSRTQQKKTNLTELALKLKLKPRTEFTQKNEAPGAHKLRCTQPLRHHLS